MANEPTTKPAIDKALLDILVCPVDHAKLTLEGDTLVCQTCKRRYPVVNGIPNMLVEEQK